MTLHSQCQDVNLGGKPCTGYCAGKKMEIGPNPILAVINVPTSVNFHATNNGGGNAVIQGGGAVFWGDNAVDPAPFNGTYTYTHTWRTAGTFTIRATAQADFKYDGNGSCSYRCCVEGTATVRVVFAPQEEKLWSGQVSTPDPQKGQKATAVCKEIRDVLGLRISVFRELGNSPCATLPSPPK
jgi:hypothetical protein